MFELSDVPILPVYTITLKEHEGSVTSSLLAWFALGVWCALAVLRLTLLIKHTSSQSRKVIQRKIVLCLVFIVVLVCFSLQFKFTLDSVGSLVVCHLRRIVVERVFEVPQTVEP